MIRRNQQSKLYSSRNSVRPVQFTLEQQYEIRNKILSQICTKCGQFVVKLIDDFNHQIYILKSNNTKDLIDPVELQNGKFQELISQNFQLNQTISFLENKITKIDENKCNQTKEILFTKQQNKVLSNRLNKQMLELRDSNKATVLKYEEKLSSAYQQIDNQNQTIRHMTQEIEKVSKRYNNILNGTNDDKASVTYLQQLIKDTNQQLQQNFKEIYQLKIQLQNYSIMEQEHQKLSNEHKYMQGQIQNLKHDLLVSQNNYQRMVQINDKFKDSLDLQSSQIITQLNQIDLYSEQIETYEKEVESLSNSQTTHFKIDITKVASKDFEYITSPKQPIVGNITDAEKLFLQEYSDIFIYKFDRMVFYNQNKKVLLDEYYSIRDQILNVNILKQCGIPINIAVRAANEEKYCLNAALQYLSANNTIYTLVHTQLEQNVFGQVVKMILAQYKVGISRNQFWVKLDTNIQFI